MRKVAVVFGGGGFIGRQLVQRLARLDYVVRATTREPDKGRGLRMLGNVGQVVPLATRLGDEADVTRAVEGAALVVNLVGILAEKREGDFDRVQGEFPGLMGRAARLAGVKRVVQVSAIGADAASPSRYARSKAAGEVALRAAFPGATIMRPSLVFGPEDSFFNRFAVLAARLPFMPVVQGDTLFQPVYVGDVVEAIMAALADDATAGRTYELGGPRVAPFRDWMRLVLDATGRNRRMIEMPPGLIRLQARIGDHLPNAPLTTDQLLLLQKDNVVAENALTLADLGITPSAADVIVPLYLARFLPEGQARMRASAL